ncbi:hypothetical protein MW887_001982 [Aspergillus wentii]|nr:hypothetical protein MW887_001982 [Aspergillus wentii]
MGTCDTKKDEMLFTKQQILAQKTCLVRAIDLGSTSRGGLSDRLDPFNEGIYTSPVKDTIYDAPDISKTEYVEKIIAHVTDIVSNLYKDGAIHGVIGVGGSSGTSLVTAVMRHALPVGFPKLMVSTMASGDVKPYVEETDITMMYSVVDIAGTNWILNRILSNAAAAIGAMAATFEAAQAEASSHEHAQTQKKRVGVTMFGVTTPCVDRVRHHLEHVYGYEVYVFHATGAGGKAMERLVKEKQLDAILDITTSEIADELVGGVLTAGPDRLMAGAKAGIPQIISVGACDMVNFGPKDTVPVQFQNRLIYEHNPTVTIIRTTADECRQIARFIAQKLLVHATRRDLIRVILPTQGISLLDTPGRAYYDPEVDEVLFSTLEEELKDSGIPVLRDEREINDPGFAVAAADALAELMKQK